MTCLEENDVLALLQAGADAAPEVRDHATRCERCRSLVAMVARVVVASERSEPSGWPDGSELLRRGTRLHAYEIGEPIGEGGMGIVYAALDTRLHRRVALKLLRPGVGPALDRLRHEARITASLSHPNIVTVYDVRDSAYGVIVAMELVDGEDLARWLTHRRERAEIVAVLRQAGAGLAAAHRAGVVHRDFKPQNVLVGADGRARVVDFGLAVSRTLPDELGPALVGTPAFIAPEQIRGQRVDARADQFSFCVVAFVALTGERPFRGRDLASLLAEIEAGRIARAPGLPGRVRAAIERGLAADPADRFATLDDLLASMDRRSRARWWIPAAGLVAGAAFVAAPNATPPAATEDALAHPHDDGLEQRYRQLHAEVQEAHAAGLWPRDREHFIAQASRLRADAMAAADDRSLARAEMLIGSFARWDARHEDGQLAFEAAFMAAERAGDRGSAFEAARTLWTMARVVDGDAAAAERWRGTAELAALQTGDPEDRARFVVDDVKAMTDATVEAHAQAVKRLDEAERLFDEETSAMIREELVSTRGHHRLRSGDPEGAMTDYRRSIDLLTAEFGPDSFELGYALNGMAVAQTALGQLEDAAGTLRQLLRIIPPNPNNPDHAAVRGNLAQVYVQMGDYDRALAEFHAVREAFEAFHGPRHLDVTRTTVGIASTLYQLGRFEEARREAEDALRWGPAAEHRIPVKLLWAGATAKLGDVEAARPALQEVIADPDATDLDRTQAAEILAGLNTAAGVGG